MAKRKTKRRRFRKGKIMNNKIYETITAVGKEIETYFDNKLAESQIIVVNAEISGNTFDAIGAKNPTKRQFGWGIDLAGVTNVKVEKNKFINEVAYSNRYQLRYDPTVKEMTQDVAMLGLFKPADNGGKQF